MNLETMNKKIGITYQPSESLFCSGLNQTALFLAELLLHLGYHVTLLDTKNSDTLWWTDYPKMKVDTSNFYQVKGLDWLIDIDGRISSDQRKVAAENSIIFLRNFLQFSEMESTVYIDAPYRPRDMTGVHSLWCWDILNPEETIPSIQTLFPCPIVRVPFIWSSTVVSHFIKQNTKVDVMNRIDSPWTVHVAEKNVDNTGSCVLPLIAIRELVTKKHINAVYKLHNMEHIKDNKFFKENVANNIEMDTLPIEILPKEPYYKWANTQTVLFSHARFTYLRIGLLNALWMGIPVVHNSCVLSDLHPSLKMLFYNGNDVKEIISAFTNLTSTPLTWYSTIEDVQQKILDKFSIENNTQKWSMICDAIFKSVTPVTPITPVTPVTHVTPVTPVKPLKQIDNLVIAFEDMWPGFNYDSNFIMDALRHEQPSLLMKGVKYDSVITPNLLIFGPYTENWKQIPHSIPKVYFSAENWIKPVDNSIQLYLTSSSNENDTNMRIPTWLTFINWFSNATTLPESCQDNPIRLPLHFAMTPHAISFKERTKFCGFVVSNPICKIRNDTFHVLNNYKTVNSGGALFNNIGGQLSLKYPGGGCGDISKHHFFAEHRYTISFENSQSAGYVTEKLLHAKMAGCVPLYWGDATTTDFVPNSFINLSNISDPELVVEVVKKLESNPDMCDIIASTPLLNQEKKENALHIMSRMSKRLLELAGFTANQLEGIAQTYVINLDTRPDRWNNLMSAEPYLKDIVTREPAVNGRQLKMTQEIYNMFTKNQFQWKKSVIGCNLSHISVWSKIAKQESGKYFLVLEDDVRFTKNWQELWKNYVKCIPEDADLLYLGGVLPPNKHVLPLVTEKVNDYWSFIKPNTYFSPVPLPVFHFCAYSYILTRRGAQKLMDHLSDSELKSFTVSDHLLGHPSVGLTKYYTNPLLSYCFQEEDPVYVKSEFNNLHRQDTFDSDLWNNTDCFTKEDLDLFVTCDIQNKEPVLQNEVIVEPVKEQVSDKTPASVRIYCMSEENKKESYFYEKTWLEDMFQAKIELINIFTAEILDNSWYLVQRPYVEKLSTFFQALKTQGLNFKVLHLSDEYCMDSIEYYSYPNCKAVIRAYLRQDVPHLPHVITIPLGYHHKYTGQQKSWEEREFVWSFHGTNWHNRQEQLQTLVSFVPFSCNLQPNWNHPTATKERQYLSLMANSKFCPVMRGQNVETFRMYEALETGALPITFVNDVYSIWIDENLNLSSLYDWKNPHVVTQPITEEIRQKVMEQWSSWKQRIKESLRKYVY